MPFHKRIVEPRSLGRINRGRPEVNGDVFISLDAVNCQTLINILRQLSDLSRHASSMFVEIQTESALVINKASALQHRLDSLQDTVRNLNHKRTTVQSNSSLFLRVRLQGESMSKPDVGPALIKSFTDTVFLSQPDECTPSFFVYL
ncbi:Wiskott-Aldrich syndrome protein family member 2 [Anabarilius grahami]|uniref:Wiskott-Aldrich syndrome protein family member 2 n=1 Tax=Anabarilius grahami TaxID=495550 RepID=A0A3N0YFW1_ANAGA|nr:Wiskott-Aldrich syndrome protein family member 2 [Anabarilius grahami]